MGEDRQHWRVSVPLGQSLEWDARIVEEYPDEFLHWMSLPRGYEMFKKRGWMCAVVFTP